MTLKSSNIIKIMRKWDTKATKVHQKGSQNEQGTFKKEPCGKVSIFGASGGDRINVTPDHFGSQESPGLDVTSPGPHFWTLKNVCFFEVLIGFEQTGWFAEI